MKRHNSNPNRIHFVFTVQDAVLTFASDSGPSGTVKVKDKTQANDKINEIMARFKDHYDVVSADIQD